MNQKIYSDQELKGKWYLMRHCPENCEAGKKAVHLRSVLVAERMAEQNPGPARASPRCGVYEESLQHQDESPGCDLSVAGTQRTVGYRKKGTLFLL